MHVHLTDRLTCPRCGPRFGLILLAELVEDQRVMEGLLGCANCRDGFPVRNGFGDLRAPPRGALEPGAAGARGRGDPVEVDRISALLGVLAGPGTLALVGAAAGYAPAVAERVSDIEVVAVDADLASWPEVTGVSRIVARPGLPFFSRVLRGAVVDGALGAHWIEESARVVAPLGRVVVMEGEVEAAEILRAVGLRVLAVEDGTVVAARA